jgi:Mg-chelatase subunit ChlD
MFRLSFIYPEMLPLLLLLVPVWVLALLTPRRLDPIRFWASLGLRTVLLLALVLALAGAQFVRPVDRQTTVFLLDGSDSLTPSARAQAETFIAEALAGMENENEAALVVFGGNALVERAPSDADRLGRIASLPIATRTNIEQAIQLGLALFPSDTQKRLVLLSDGGENDGTAIEAARIASARGVPISVVDLSLPGDDAEALVASLDAPAQVREGQEAVLTARIESTVAQSANVRLLLEQTVIAEQPVELQPGSNEVRFAVTTSGSGFQRYRVQVQPQTDGRAQNNEAAALVQVQGPPRILLLASDDVEAAALMNALAATNVIAEVMNPATAPQDLAGLSPYDAVMLVNVPVRDLPVATLATLPAYVRDLGKGLVMIGGDESYGVGGYGRTPVEEALPVYMDVRDREERPDLALVFVIDKSGSMDACHCSSPDRNNAQMSQAGERKVDIAKEAMAQSSALLGPQDTIGVVSFDSSAELTLPATQGASVDQLIDAVAPVEPRGSTNVRSGLLAAEEMLADVDARIKHIILLTDGWGSGGDQQDVAERLRDQGVTLTVVAAGGGSADYLERLAETGGGRYYPAQDMADVPQIFVQETITTVGNYIIERPFFPTLIGESPLLAGIDALPQLYGYNGSTLKDTARLHLSTDDASPLLATWQYGLGRSAAWLSDSKGQWARDWVQWEGFPRFVGQLATAVLPARGSQDIATEVTVAGASTIVRLNVDDQVLAQHTLEVTATLIGGDGERQEMVLRQVAPGQYQGQILSPAPGTYLVQIAGETEGRTLVQEVAGLVVPYSAEYRGGQGNPALLNDLAASTGGGLISDPQAAFTPSDVLVTSAREIAFPLVLLALILLPLDIALRRLMVRRRDVTGAAAWVSARRASAPTSVAADPTLTRLAEAKRRATPTGERSASPTEASAEKPKTPPPPPPPIRPEVSVDPLERLREAKERARKRASGEE